MNNSNMVAIWIGLFVLLTLPLSVKAVIALGCDGKPIRNRCLSPSPSDPYEHLAVSKWGTYADTTNCYFVVKGKTYLVPVDGGVKVDLMAARNVCDSQDAMLPIVLTGEENEFLAKEYAKITPVILLGLHRVNTHNYIWDNIAGTAFKNPNWAKLPMTWDTSTLLDTGSGKWTEYLPDHVWSDLKDIPLICQQRGYGRDGQSFSDARGRWLPNACNRPTLMVERPIVRFDHIAKSRTVRDNHHSNGITSVPWSTFGLIVLAILVAAII